MNHRIETLKNYILDKKHHSLRRSAAAVGLEKLNEQFAAAGSAPVSRAAQCLKSLLEHETPVILPGERIVVTRTIKDLPEIFTPAEWDEIKSRHYLHERGTVCNISPNYEHTLRVGLEARRTEIAQRLTDPALTSGQRVFLESALLCVTSLQAFVGKYEAYARAQGETETADVLKAIQTQGATGLREALQLLRVLHFSIWEASNYHNTLGRFDQYIYPYYKADIKKGVLTQEEAFDLVEEFFLSCNKDSDLYPGMQQGDNGQSLVLGGRNEQGEYLFNDLSEMCLRASYELELIDPKINIRVDKETPDAIYEMGSRLTKKGLGFPQYSNDDIIVPGLIAKGYDKADAYNYVVAACWEFIIPNCALDIPNIDAVALAECVKSCMPRLNECADFDAFYRLVEQKIESDVDAICRKHQNLYIVPAPMMSVLMDDTIARATDISEGGKYNNYGLHGTGIATAADSLAAIKKHYFEEKDIDYPTYMQAMADDMADERVRNLLRNETPKMGQDDDYVDSLATRLLDSFDHALTGRHNERGGIYRAGTGTAMYYIWHATDMGATPDGRKREEMIPANYSPSLFIKQKGPISVIKSFTKPHLDRVMNGGPLTLEFDQSIFRNDESVKKLGQLVKTYVVLGGHQLQLNTVSREKLLDAKAHPENYRNLIVRVWGWSGYFVELDECYQDHVINRIEFGL